MESEFFVVFNFGLGGVEDYEVGFLFEFGLVLGTDEHVGHEVGLPCYFHDEAYFHACVFVGTAEAVNYIEALFGELLCGNLSELVPCFL